MKRNILIGSLVCIIILWGVLVSACQPAAQPAATQSIIVSNTATISPTPSPTGTATPTSTPIPDWEVVATFGNGVIPQYLYSEDESKIVVLQVHTISVLDGKTMEELSSLALPDEVFNGDDATLECISPDASLAIISSREMIENSFSIVDIQSGYIHTEDIHYNSDYSDFKFTPNNNAFLFRSIYFGSYSTIHSLYQWTRSSEDPENWNATSYKVELDDTEAERLFTSPALSSDGSMMAAGFSGNSTYAIIIWNTETTEQLLKIENQPTRIIDVVFSKEGKWLVSISKDSILRIWDVNDGHLIKQVTGFNGSLSEIELSEDGQFLTVYYEGNLRRAKINLSSWQIVDGILNTATWDSFASYMLEKNYLLDSGYSLIQFSPDGSLLAVVNGNIQIWDVESHTLKQVLTAGNTLCLASVTFSDDGSKFAVKTYGDIVIVWEIESGEQILFVTPDILEISQPVYTLGSDEREPGSGRPESVQFTHDGEFLIIPNGPVMELWDLARQKKIRAFEQTPILSFIRKVSLSKDGNTVYALLDSYDRYAAWNFKSGEFLYEGQTNEYQDSQIRNAEINHPAIAVYEYAYEDKALDMLHTIDTGNEDKRKSIELFDSNVEGISLSTDGKYVGVYSRVSSDSPNGSLQIDIRKTNDLSLIASKKFDSRLGSFTFSSDGNFLAAIINGKVTLYGLRDFTSKTNEVDFTPLPEPNTPTPHPTSDQPTKTPNPTLVLQTLQVPTESGNDITKKNAVKIHELDRAGLGKVHAVKWQTNGDLQIVSTQGLFILNQQNLEIVEEYKVQDLNVITSAKSGNRFLVAGEIPNHGVQVRDGKTNETVLRFENGSQAVISPNGRWLTYLVNDTGICTWNLQTNQSGPILKVDGYNISQPVFSPDSRYVAVSLYDRSIRIWDIEKGFVINAVGGPIESITDFAFSADGNYVVAASGGSAWWWNLTTHEANHLDIFDGVYREDFPFDELTFPDAVMSVSINSSNSMLAIATNQREILFYDLKKSEFTELVLKPNASAVKIGFNASNTKLYSVDADGQLVIWDLKDGSRIVQNHIFIDSIHGLVPHLNGQISVWSNNSLWTLNDKQFELDEKVSFDVKVIFSIDPTGEFVVGYSPDQVSIYDSESGVLLSTLVNSERNTELPNSISDSPIWYGATFNADGKMLVIYGDDGVWFYNVDEFQMVDYYNLETCMMADFSLDGEMLLLSQGYWFGFFPQLISTNPIEELSNSIVGSYPTWLDTGENISIFRISPDKSEIITFSSTNGEFRLNLINMESSEILVEKLIDNRVWSIAYNPSGTLIAAGLEDGSVLLLDANTLETVSTLQAHTASVNHLVFTTDGEKLITVAEDGVVKVWGVK